MITLIANSGIQFHKFQLSIDTDEEEIIKPIGFHEKQTETLHGIDVKLQYAYYLPDEDLWVNKQQLKQEEGLLESGELADDINLSRLTELNEDNEFYAISDIEDCLDLYKNVWLPFPYFKKERNQYFSHGPLAWCRCFLQEITPKGEKKARIFQVVLSFDTKVDSESTVYFAPNKSDTASGANYFGLCNKEDDLLNFCNEEYNGGWVSTYLLNLVHEGKLPNEFPSLKYLAYYLYLIKYLGYHQSFPDIELFSDDQAAVDVDLVLDIGNANTCGILFESPLDKSSFKFTSVEKLVIQDLSNPSAESDQPFSMRLAFAKAQFGDITITEYSSCFKWGSFLRLGKEAQRLITKYNLEPDQGGEMATHHSSPKRYLWDNKRSEIPWEFVNIGLPTRKNDEDEEDDIFFPTHPPMSDPIYIEGISEQFKPNGDFAFQKDSAILPHYSRKSLMTFVFIEIFLHAFTQVNSHKFRDHHGNRNKPRRLKRVTITCPTSIVQEEQVILRSCALDAARAIDRFNKNTYNEDYDDDSELKLEIIPSPKDLGKKLSQLGTKKDWIYDEATCCQLVFLYAEISERYLNNAEMFFKLYGKKRADVVDKETRALTIGTIDIGGGTTDLMICAYQYEPNQSAAVLIPQPLYWESFNLAGDDLLKNIIQEVLLSTAPEHEEEVGCKGVISHHAQKLGCINIAEKMLNFFGTDTARSNHIQQLYRKNFTVQVAIPIALRYLEHASDKEAADSIEVDFDVIFKQNRPNTELIRFFNDHMGNGFDLTTITWKLSKRKVFDVVNNTFDKLLKQLSMLMSAYGCDFVLLAGKPTTLPKIREMFVKYYPVSPDRIITLNNYRVGRWYPFANDIGYFEDPKTIVSVGALIALMGNKLDKLDGFRLDTRVLRKKLISTSDYMGVLNKNTYDIDITYLTPDENRNKVNISNLPITIGYKQLPNKHYPGRPIYLLDFNDTKIREKVVERNRMLDTDEEIKDEIEAYKNNLKNRMPFRVKLTRQMSESKEVLHIEDIKDNNRQNISRNFLSLSLMTLPDISGYWLDTGVFTLNIK